MKSFFRSLKAETLKIKHTPLLWLHLIIPLVGVGLFLFTAPCRHGALRFW